MRYSRDIFVKKFGFGDFVNPYLLMKNKWENDIEDLIFGRIIQETGFFNIETIKKLWRNFQQDQLGKDEKLMFSKFVVFCVWYKFNFSSS